MRDIYTITAAEWEDVFRKHLHCSKQTRMYAGDPKWDAEGLNVLGVRMNPIEEFYLRGIHGWNDWLVFVMKDVVELFRCTTDPAVVHENPKGIAHLSEGVWESYARGTHKAPWRTALVQSKAPVHVVRTRDNGRITMSERGYFGINIHNAAGWNKPSAGCTVIMPDKVLGVYDKNFHRFKDMLKAAPDRPARTYCLLNAGQMAAYGYEVLI